MECHDEKCGFGQWERERERESSGVVFILVHVISRPFLCLRRIGRASVDGATWSRGALMRESLCDSWLYPPESGGGLCHLWQLTKPTDCQSPQENHEPNEFRPICSNYKLAVFWALINCLVIMSHGLIWTYRPLKRSTSRELLLISGNRSKLCFTSVSIK